MDRFTIIITTVVISVLLSVGAVVSGATGMLQSVFGTTESTQPTPGSHVVRPSSGADHSDEIDALRNELASLKDQLVAANSAVERPASSREAELEARLTDLQRVNDEQAEQIARLEEMLQAGSGFGSVGSAGETADGSTPGAEGAGVAGATGSFGSPQFKEAVIQAVEEREKEERDRRMLERRDRMKEEVIGRAPRIAEFVAERMELDAAQQAIVEQVIVEFTTARADLEYQAYTEDWDEQTRRTQNEALVEETRSSLESAGFTEDQMNGIQRFAMRAGGGRGDRGPGGRGR